MNRYKYIFVQSLPFWNIVRIICDPRLWSVERLYVQNASNLARRVFGNRLQQIRDHPFDPYKGKNYFDVRTLTILAITHQHFKDEPNRYLQRFLRQKLARSLNGPIGLIQDYDILSSQLDGRTCLLMPWTPIMQDLRMRYETAQLTLSLCIGNWHWEERPIYFPFDHVLRDVAFFAVRFAQTVVGLVRSPRRLKTAATTPYAISVVNGRGGVSPRHRHDLFWLSSKPLKYPILLECHGMPHRISDDYARYINSRGINIVETYWKPHETHADRWVPGPRYLRRSCMLLAFMARSILSMPRRETRFHFWTLSYVFRFRMFLNERLDFFETFNIRVQVNSGYVHTEPIDSCALSLLGGANCVVQYTTTFDLLANHTTTAAFHCYFGNFVSQWEYPLEAEVNIFNGYTFKTALAEGCDTVEQLRRVLDQKEVTESLCFLDEAHRDDPVGDMIMEFYESMIERIIARPHFALVVKPKRHGDFDLLKEKLGDKFQRAIETGRFVILDWQFYPGLAGQAVDVTIGIMSTATLESAVSGCRTVHLNPFGYVLPFMTKVTTNIYDSIPIFERDLEEFFSDTRSDFGLHGEEFLRSVDHLRDDDVSRRIEVLLTGYLDALTEGATRDVAIEQAVSRLSRRWPAVGTEWWMRDRPHTTSTYASSTAIALS